MLREMDALDPKGRWLDKGAPFVRTIRTGKDFSTKRGLEIVLQDLKTLGKGSRYFTTFYHRKGDAACSSHAF